MNVLARFRSRSALAAAAFSAAGMCAAGVTTWLVACGGGTPPPKTSAIAPGGSKDPSKWPADDRTMCDWKEHPEYEVSETEGPGALRPNVRRVYKVLGEKDTRRTVLICREIDTNLDGIKDVVRTFNEKGEPVEERADTNYDGKIDVWIKFAGGRLAEEDIDETFAGQPNVWKFYVDGRLYRIRRNTHCPGGKPDTWETYAKNGSLERVGNDTTCDGRVDRWDRDTDVLRQQEEEQAKQLAAMDAGSGTEPVVFADDAGTRGAGADAGKPKKR
jgi:hypothetical protein